MELSPVRKIDPGREYDISVFRGTAYPYPMRMGVRLKQDLLLKHVYLQKKESSCFPLYPLMFFDYSADYDEARLYALGFRGGKETEGRFFDIEDDTAVQGNPEDLIDFMKRVSLDYHYQKDPWKRFSTPRPPCCVR